MRNILLVFICILFMNNFAFASNYSSTKNYKLNEYNSRGQKTGYTKVYYQGNRDNIRKVEKYSTNGKRTNLYR